MWMVVLLSLLAGCGPSYEPGALLPDFSLPDVNPNSPSYGQDLGPSMFRGQVSAWYFGHAT